MPNNQYRIAIVRNKLGIVHLRLLPPRGGEIIMSGELLSDERGARRTAENIQKSVGSRGLRIVDVWEGPKE